MSLVAVGLNHTTAPLELREKLVVPRDDIATQLESLGMRAGLSEVMLLSTCNRVEVYGVPQTTEPMRIIQALAALRGEGPRQFEGHYFARQGMSAVRHIFRVTASLESMVVGEPQILGQVKDAFQIAREHGTVGATLDRCMTMAFRGAKRVRTETQIARGGASISSVAVDLAASIFGSLAGARVALLGAGEMAQHAATHLRAAGCGDMEVVNRSQDRGQALAETVAGRYVPWSDLNAALIKADIVICSTGASEAVVTPQLMKQVMRKRRGRPVFLVDIAVPRDVDPAVGKMEQVFAYDIDDLQQIVAENMSHRGAQADAARKVLDEEIEAFFSWKRTRDVAPTISSLQELGQGIVKNEFDRHRAKLSTLDATQREAVEKLVHGVVQKLLHKPMHQLRTQAQIDSSEDPDPSASAENLAQAVRSLFDLDQGPPANGASPPTQPAASPTRDDVEPASGED